MSAVPPPPADDLPERRSAEHLPQRRGSAAPASSGAPSPPPRRPPFRRILVAVVAIAAIAAAVAALAVPGSSPVPAAQRPAYATPVPKKMPHVLSLRENPKGETTGILPGRHALNFDWLYPNGSVEALVDLRGKVVVLNWWATWCLPCVEEMPTLDKVAASEPEVLFLEIDLYEHEDDVERFFAKHGLRYLLPIIDWNGVAVRKYAIGAGIPQTHFLDAQGVIRAIEIGGPMPEETIRRGVASARGR